MRPLPDLLDHDVALDVAETFKALSDPTRVKILCALRGQELCVGELGATLDVTDSAVSHQLRGLRSMGLVKYRREGRRAYYSLADAHIEQLLNQGLERTARR